MPNYEFECDSCGNLVEVYRPMKLAGKPQDCDHCGVEMRRIFTTQTNVKSHGYYNHGLGQYVRGSWDVKDAMKRIQDGVTREYIDSAGQRVKKHVEGPELVEVGDSKPVVRERSGLKMTAKEDREFGNMLKSWRD
jgi:putative FmdB family regulatory protein